MNLIWQICFFIFGRFSLLNSTETGLLHLEKRIDREYCHQQLDDDVVDIVSYEIEIDGASDSSFPS